MAVSIRTSCHLQAWKHHHLCLTYPQDTRRILQDEIDILRSNIFRIENVAKAEAEKQNAEEMGWANLARLEEQVGKITARIDKAKLSCYFPEVKGYRWVCV